MTDPTTTIDRAATASSHRTATRSTHRLATVLIAACLAAGCTTTSDDPPEPGLVTTNQEGTVTNTLTDPTEVLALAGLTLPEDTLTATVESIETDYTAGSYYAYLVTLTTPPDTITTWTDDKGTVIHDKTASRDNLPLFDDEKKMSWLPAPLPQGTRSAMSDLGPESYGHYDVYMLGPDLTTTLVFIEAFPKPTPEGFSDGLTTR